MSVPGGGFQFRVGIDITQARRGFAELIQQAQQTRSQLQSTLGGAAITINTRQAVDEVRTLGRQIKETVDEATRGSLTVAVKGDITDFQGKFTQVTNEIRRLDPEYKVSIKGDAQDLTKTVNEARNILRQAQEGDRFTVRILANADQFRQVVRQIGPEMQAAFERGAKVSLVGDAEGARREAERVARDAARAAVQAEREEKARLKAAARQDLSDSIKINVVVEDKDAPGHLKSIAQAARDIPGRVTVRIEANARENAGAIDNVRQSLSALQKGDVAIINLKVRPEEAVAAVKSLEHEMDEAKKRGADFKLEVNTSEAEARISAFRQLAVGGLRGALRGIGLGEGALIGTSAGFGAVAGLAAAEVTAGAIRSLRDAAAATIEYNSRMEQLQRTLEHFTGSAEASNQAIQAFNKIAEVSPFGQQQIQESGAAFIRVSHGDIERASQLTELTTALAAAHPEQPFQSMQQAIQQLISGDYRAFEDRTNIAFGTVRRLSEQGLTGMNLYRKAVEEAGGSTELLVRNRDTFQAQLTTFQSALQRIGGEAGQGGFANLVGVLRDVNKWIKDNEVALVAFGRAAGNLGQLIVGSFIGMVRLLADAAVKIAEIGSAIDHIMGRKSLMDQVREEQERFQTAQRTTTPTEDVRAGAIREYTAIGDKIAENNGKIQQEEQAQKRVDDQLKIVARDIGALTDAYQGNLVPIQRQLELLSRVPEAVQRAQLTARQLQVQADAANARATGVNIEDPRIAVIAEANANLAVAEHKRSIIQLQQQQIAGADQIRQIEASIAQSIAGQGFRERERAIRADQRAAEVAKEARDKELADLRQADQERQRSRQNDLDQQREVARDAAEMRRQELDGIRETHRLAQQARQDEIEGIREANRLQRQRYQDEREGIQEVERLRRQQIDDDDRRRQRAHQRDMERIQDRINAIEREGKAKSPAEQELENLDKVERVYQQQQRLADARRAVADANTLAGQIEARRRLAEVEHEIAVENQRTKLQDQVQRENAERQERIQRLQDRSSREDRQFQRDEQRRQDDERNKQRKFDDDQRKAEHDQRVLERQQDEAVRQKEQDDRVKQRQEEKETRDKEQANRLKDAADQEAIRIQERANRKAEQDERDAERAKELANRAADEADRHRIQAEQDKLQADQDAFQDHLAAVQLQNDRDRLTRLKELAAVDDQIIQARLKILGVQNDDDIANAARATTLAQGAQNAATIAAGAAQVFSGFTALNLDLKVKALTDEYFTQLYPLEELRKKYESIKRDSEATAAAIDLQNQALAKQRSGLNPNGRPGETDPSDHVFGNANEPQANNRSGRTGYDDPKGPYRGGAVVKTPTMKEILGWDWGDITKEIAGVGRSAFEGLAAYFRGQSAEKEATKQATKDAMQEGVIDAAYDALGARSPSRKFAELAQTVGPGFEAGLAGGEGVGNRQADVIGKAMFDTFQSAFDEWVVPFFTAEDGFTSQVAGLFGRAGEGIGEAQEQLIGQAMTTSLSNVWVSYVYPAFEAEGTGYRAKFAEEWGNVATSIESRNGAFQAALLAPFEFVRIWMPGFEQEMYVHGQNAEVQFQNGYYSADLFAIVRGPFEQSIEWLKGFGVQMQGFGSAAGVGFQNGFNASSPINAIVSDFNYLITDVFPQYYQSMNNIGNNFAVNFQNGWQSTMAGWQPFRGTQLELGSTVQQSGRPNAAGGAFGAFELLTVGERGAELAAFPRSGSIVPNDLVKAIAQLGYSQASQEGIAPGGTPVQLSITNNISGGGGDPDTIAEMATRKTVDAVIRIFDHAQRNAPNQVTRNTPGAV